MLTYTPDLIWKHAEGRIINTSHRDQCGFCYRYYCELLLQKSLDPKNIRKRRSTFNSDYLSLSPQSTNCSLIVWYKKTVKFITVSSQWLFWYWLKGLIKSLERKTEGQISESVKSSMRLWRMMSLHVFSSPASSVKKWIIKAHFSSESFPILTFSIERSSRREQSSQRAAASPQRFAALCLIHWVNLKWGFSTQWYLRHISIL